METLKEKLASRKFWTLVVTFVTSILLTMNLDENQIAQIIAIITAGGSVIAYLLGQSYIDGKKEQNRSQDSTNG